MTMSIKEEATKIVGAILSSTGNGFGIDVKRFRKEYRARIGSEFPIKDILDEDYTSDESVDVQTVVALEKLGFGMEKTLVPIGRDKTEEALFVVQLGKDKGKSRAGFERKPNGRKGSAKPKSKKNSSLDYLKKTPTLTAKTVIPGSDSDALSMGDCPFVMKQTSSHCNDMVTIIAKLRTQQIDVPAMDRMKLATRIQFSEYPPETMSARFLSRVAKYFADDASSYVIRADELPSRFYLRVTHVEEDGFRLWGRPILEGRESSNKMDNPSLRDDADCLAHLERMDQRLTEIVQSEVDRFVDKFLTEGDGEGDGIVNAQRPVVVFRGGRWQRGWTMQLDSHAGEVHTRVFLIDDGLVVLEESEKVTLWVSEKSQDTLPLALPFFLKGCQRQNRGPTFVRQQILGKVVVVAKSFINLTEYTGKCVTPVVVLNWADGEGEKHCEGADQDEEEADLQSATFVPSAAETVDPASVSVSSDKNGYSLPSRSGAVPNTPFTESDARSSLNFYHGEATMETNLPEDAVHRSLMARIAQFGWDPFDMVKHVAQKNVKILEAYRNL